MNVFYKPTDGTQINQKVSQNKQKGSLNFVEKRWAVLRNEQWCWS